MGIFFFFYFKNSASSRLLAKISVSQVFWDPIENSVSPRSALLEAALLEALLYLVSGGAGGALATPEFRRSVNPISTRGGRLCLLHYYLPTELYVASYVPESYSISVEVAVMDRLLIIFKYRFL